VLKWFSPPRPQLLWLIRRRHRATDRGSVNARLPVEPDGGRGAATWLDRLAAVHSEARARQIGVTAAGPPAPITQRGPAGRWVIVTVQPNITESKARPGETAKQF